MNKVEPVNKLNLSPEQALGVALSCSPVWQNSIMEECQFAAPRVLKHLNNMGFHLVHVNNLRERSSDEVGSYSSENTPLGNGDIYEEVS